MFNPEKLLGGLIRSGVRGRGLGRMVSGGAALGLVGVAMEAVEHYMGRTGAESRNRPPDPPPLPGSAPPPPPPSSRVSVPPRPPAVPAGPVAEAASGHAAVLLIRAMIAAANADGVIDSQERARILEKLKSLELSQEEHQFILHELLTPKGMQDIVSEVNSGDLARQVYAASLLAIEVDTEEEKGYLQRLAANLGLDSAAINAIHRQVQVPKV